MTKTEQQAARAAEPGDEQCMEDLAANRPEAASCSRLWGSRRRPGRGRGHRSMPGTLSAIDWSKDTVTGTVKVGTLPHWIALAPGGRVAYVTNENSNDLTVVNLDTMTVTATIPVGNAPRKIVVRPAAASRPVTAVIAAFTFPDSLRIKAGQSVSWTNSDAVPHTVTADDGSWDSGDIATGKIFSMTFQKAGTFAYHCANHPAMTGMVIVS